MTNNEELNEIIIKLNDNRSKLSALFSLYNSSLLDAEEGRAILSEYYEQMIDFKNDLNTLSTLIGNTKKSERSELISKNKSKMKTIHNEIGNVTNGFNSTCKKYRLALSDCGSLKTEYKHEVSELCKRFKSMVDENTPAIVIKGYKQQVRIIKAIFEKIEALISDYNVKKNKVEEDSEMFNSLVETVNSMIEQLSKIAWVWYENFRNWSRL